MRKRRRSRPREAGIDALVVMWQGASEQKIEATRGYGATVDLEARGPAEAFERLSALIEETGRTLVHPFDDPLVIAGAGTVGLEIEEDAPDADAVIVPVGGGGLISGIQTAIGDRVRVIAIEPETSTALHTGLERGEPTWVEPTSIADGLNAPIAGALPLEICSRLERAPGQRGRDRARLPAPVRAGQARVRARRRGGHRSLAERPDRGRTAGRSRLRRQRRDSNGRCYPGAAMKAEIHPEYVLSTVHCGCGNTFTTRSTQPELHVEICSACHPFYTGKQKLLDTGGRVERFQRRLEKAERAARSSS